MKAVLYNYYRDYDPQTGRYIQSDPIGLRGGLNTHAYARNEPVRRVDPLGLDTVTATIGGSLVGGAGIAGSVGVYVSNKPFDVGVIVQGEYGYGVNLGGSVQFGYQTGPLSNVSNPSVNYNVSPGVVSLTIQTDPVTGEIQGGAIGPAVRALASKTYARAETFGLRGLFDRAFDRLGELWR